MHPLDLVLYLLLLAWPLARLSGWHRSRALAMGFSVAAVLWLALSLTLDLPRWPLVPALLLVIAWEIQAVSIMVGDVPPPARSRLARLAPATLGLLLVFPAVALPAWVLPRAPAFVPGGSFLVGVSDLAWADSTRLGPDGQPHLVPVRLWFPAEPATRPIRALRHRALKTFERDLAARLPGARGSWIVRGFTRAPLRISADMRLATRQRSYPVVILSHATPGSPALHATLATELASHGYVVASPEHLGASLGSVLPDGEYVPARVATLEPGSADPAWPTLAAADGRAVLAGLEMLAVGDTAGRFTGRLQLDEVGWVGQGSGAQAGALLADEGLISALVALDPTGHASPGEQDAAVLVIGRESAEPRSGSGNAMFAVEMPGAGLADFSDLAWWSPPLLRRAGWGGNIRPRDAQAAIHRLTVAFLGVTLRNEPANLRGLVDSLAGVRLDAPQPAG